MPFTKSALLILCLAGLTACTRLQEKPKSDPTTSSQPTASAKRKGDELIFLGTITNIAPAASMLPTWIITTKVNKVVSGKFSGNQFQFTVECLGIGLLEKGKQYRIRAERTANGYFVDETQFIYPRSRVGAAAGSPR